MLLAVMQAIHDSFRRLEIPAQPAPQEDGGRRLPAANPAAHTAIGSVAHGSSLRQFTGVNLTSLDYSAIRRDVTSYPARTLLCPMQEHLYGAFMLVNTNASRILTPDDAFAAIG